MNERWSSTKSWLEYLAVSRGERMLRIPRSIGMENARQAGNQGWDSKRDVGRLGQAAEKASNWLWMKRDEKSWSITTGP